MNATKENSVSYTQEYGGENRNIGGRDHGVDSDNSRNGEELDGAHCVTGEEFGKVVPSGRSSPVKDQRRLPENQERASFKVKHCQISANR